MNVSRRAALMSSIPVALAVAGCVAGSEVTPANVIADASAIVSGLSGALAQVLVASPNLIPPVIAAQASSALASAQALLGGLTTSTAASTGASILVQVEGYVNTALGYLAPLVPPPYNVAVEAAVVLLPIVENFISQFVTPPPVPAAARKLARPGAMSASEARAVLNEAAARRL
jgi:hypothetical protein